MKRLNSMLRANILAGLAVLIPVALTIYVLNIVIDMTDQLFLLIPSEDAVSRLKSIPGISVVLALVLFFFTGAIARNYFGNLIVATVNKILERIPIIASIYKTLRQITESFIGKDGKKGFEKPVYVQWPSEGVWTLAFVTSTLKPSFLKERGDNQDWYHLFVPATPNPTSGFYFMAPKEACVDASMSIEEAFKIIISAGALVSPEKGS